MDEDFLLNSDTAKKLYHEFAEKMPIIDYHCHINPKEIAEDRSFSNMTEVWLSGDHYKWRFMRFCGVDEKYITGNSTDEEKFKKFSQCLTKAIGNPLMHWSHLELKRYFNYDGVLNRSNWKEVYDLCNEKLKSDSMTARGIIKASNVKVICTTDDPVDDLRYHKQIAEDESFDVKVLPSFRPDLCVNIEGTGFVEYIKKLSDVCGFAIDSVEDLKKALAERIEYFDSVGCKVADHGPNYVCYREADDNEVNIIFQKKISGAELSELEIVKYISAMMVFLHKEYYKKGWVSQLHFGCSRNPNEKMLNSIGANTGYDCIGSSVEINELARFLNALDKDNSLPKTIVYSLNPNDNEAIDTIIGSFQDSSAVGKIQHGSAWWFNDNKVGIEEHIKSLMMLTNLSGFVGMLTDSRSFLSYTRHEYFRRILCDIIGDMVEKGEFPADMDVLGEIVSDISYNNANRYFEF